jgi:hypothetical protein
VTALPTPDLLLLSLELSANSDVLHREDIVTATAPVPLGLLVEHHVAHHMDVLREGIEHVVCLRTLIADEDHLAVMVL